MIDELKKRDNLLDGAIANTERKIYKEYLKIAKDLELKLRKLYQDIEDDGEPLLSHLYQYNRYYELLNTIQDDLIKLGQYEKKVLEQDLIKLYLDNSSIINGYGDNLFSPRTNIELVKQVVNSNWGGRAKTWSDSIWANNKAIAERIQSDIVNIITTGKPYKEVATALSKDFGVRYHEAQRLIRTEMVRVGMESSLKTYADMGYELVKWVTVHDDRTCSPECEEHEGQIIRIDMAEVGINIPPIHPNCRCSIVPVRREDNV